MEQHTPTANRSLNDHSYSSIIQCSRKHSRKRLKIDMSCEGKIILWFILKGLDTLPPY